MLMLTGYHGEYGPYGILNNLNKTQLQQLVQTAKHHNVEFNHIIADSCCAPFGLKVLSGLLADGGEAIGDRMTSTAYKMQDKVEEKILLAEAQGEGDEKALINAVINEGMITLNAPIYITKERSQNGEKLTAIGTTGIEVKTTIINAYKNAGFIDQQLSEQHAIAF